MSTSRPVRSVVIGRPAFRGLWVHRPLPRCGLDEAIEGIPPCASAPSVRQAVRVRAGARQACYGDQQLGDHRSQADGERRRPLASTPTQIARGRCRPRRAGFANPDLAGTREQHGIKGATAPS